MKSFCHHNATTPKGASNSDQYSWEIYIYYMYNIGYKFAYMANGECNAYMVSLLQNKRLN